MLQPTGLAVLDKMGLASKALALGTPIERIFGQAGNRTVLDVRYAALGEKAPMAVGIHRSDLFELLHTAATGNGVGVSTGRRVRVGWDRPRI